MIVVDSPEVSRDTNEQSHASGPSSRPTSATGPAPNPLKKFYTMDSTSATSRMSSINQSTHRLSVASNSASVNTVNTANTVNTVSQLQATNINMNGINRVSSGETGDTGDTQGTITTATATTGTTGITGTTAITNNSSSVHVNLPIMSIPHAQSILEEVSPNCQGSSRCASIRMSINDDEDEDGIKTSPEFEEQDEQGSRKSNTHTHTHTDSHSTHSSRVRKSESFKGSKGSDENDKTQNGKEQKQQKKKNKKMVKFEKNRDSENERDSSDEGSPPPLDRHRSNAHTSDRLIRETNEQFQYYDNIGFLSRVGLRTVELTTRIAILSLLWILFNSWWVVPIIIAIDIFVYGITAACNRQPDFFLFILYFALITGNTRNSDEFRRFDSAFRFLIIFRFTADYYIWIIYICMNYEQIENVSVFATLLMLYIIMCGFTLPFTFAFVWGKYLKRESSYTLPHQLDIFRMAKNGNVTALEDFTKYGYKFDLSKKHEFYKCTVLHCAVSTLKHDMVRYLLTIAPRLRDEPDAQDDTPLHYACRYSGSKTIYPTVKVLLTSEKLEKKNKKVFINRKNKTGNTALVCFFCFFLIWFCFTNIFVFLFFSISM